jgi:hypothetical protein
MTLNLSWSVVRGAPAGTVVDPQATASTTTKTVQRFMCPKRMTPAARNW